MDLGFLAKQLRIKEEEEDVLHTDVSGGSRPPPPKKKKEPSTQQVQRVFHFVQVVVSCCLEGISPLFLTAKKWRHIQSPWLDAEQPCSRHAFVFQEYEELWPFAAEGSFCGKKLFFLAPAQVQYLGTMNS